MAYNEEVLTVLYEKMAAEQAKFKEWLLTLPPNDILEHSYEYSIREDILCEMESYDMEEDRVNALLKSPCPLSDIYQRWLKTEDNHMDNIQGVIDTCADHVIAANKTRIENAR